MNLIFIYWKHFKNLCIDYTKKLMEPYQFQREDLEKI